MADFVQALATGPQVKWLVGTVTAITGSTITVRIAGGEVPEVTPVEQYTPTVGDIVHMISHETNGILALGSVPLSAARPNPPPTGTELIVQPSTFATYGPMPAQWELGTVVQSLDRVGCWFYDQFALDAAGGMVLATVAIEVTLTSGTGPPEFVEIGNTEPTGVLTVLTEVPFGVQSGAMGVPTWLNLPLDWGTDLVQGNVHGIGVVNALFTGDYTSSTGRLRLTPV